MAALHIVRFRLRADVNEGDFLAANEQFHQEAMTVLPGLERREVGRTEDGEWVLVLRYRDAASAKQQRSPTEAGKRIMSLIDKSTLSSAVFESVTG